MGFGDFQIYKELLIRYFTDDSRVKYLMLTQALKMVTMVIVIFPTQLAIWTENRVLHGRLMMVGLAMFLVAVFVVTWGWFDRFFGWWFKLPVLKHRWRECNLCSTIFALDFYAACRYHWLFMMPGVGLFLISFYIDYQNLKATEEREEK